MDRTIVSVDMRGDVWQIKVSVLGVKEVAEAIARGVRVGWSL